MWPRDEVDAEADAVECMRGERRGSMSPLDMVRRRLFGVWRRGVVCGASSSTMKGFPLVPGRGGRGGRAPVSSSKSSGEGGRAVYCGKSSCSMGLSISPGSKGGGVQKRCCQSDSEAFSTALYKWKV